MKVYLCFFLTFFALVGTAQNNPVANDDYYTILSYQMDTSYFPLLNNDFDPDNDEFIIHEITQPQKGVAEIYQDSLVRYVPNFPYSYMDSFFYRIAKKNSPGFISSWTRVDIESSRDTANLINCKNDYETALGGMPLEVNVLENDLNFSTDSSMLFIVYGGSGRVQKTDSSIIYTPLMSHADGTDSILYSVKLRDSSLQYGFAYLIVEVENNHSYDSVNINNINAGVKSYGTLFCDNEYTDDTWRPRFEVPKGSGKNTIFYACLWIGGKHNGELHLAGERFRDQGADFFSGPVSDVYDSIYFRKYARTWKLTTDDIAYHMAHFGDEGYEAIEAIHLWPGNGDVGLGQAEQLAPFCDYNDNGIYEPYAGDYPKIRGDQAVYFIFNDEKGPHTGTNGKKLGVEIHGMMYAFDRPEDSALFNTVFLHYDIFNRSDKTYDSTFLGFWTDTDIGDAWDDFIGCHVQGGYYYGYNGDSIDGEEDNLVYGLHPPAQSVSFLAGPLMDNDNLDNPAGLCDESINGLHFGDGIVDNERLGMTGFIYHNNTGGILGDPRIAPDFYNYISGRWKDSTHVKYGGNGHPEYGSSDVDARFMFPWNSDTCNWGTGAVQVSEEPWNEMTVGNDSWDRRGVGSTGPFIFEAGEKLELDMAFVFARDFDGDHLDALEILEERNAYLKEKVKNGELIYLPDCSPEAVEEKDVYNSYQVYPNPAAEYVMLKIEDDQSTLVKIYDLTGKLRYQTSTQSQAQKINLDFLESGFYFIQLDNGRKINTFKLIKL